MMKRVPVAVILLLSFLTGSLLAAELPTAKPEQDMWG
jgi:uncharacterized integral membrane protein